MITDLLFFILILAFCIFGLRHPFIALSGVIWVDTVKPQLLSYSFLAGKPLSLIATAILLLSYMINFKNLKWPVTKSPIVFLVLMMLWISLTTWWAHYPKPAAFKYEVAVKTMIFALMIPFALDSRRKIECVLWVFIVAAAYFVMTGGIQAMLGGGGYGVSAVDSRNPITTATQHRLNTTGHNKVGRCNNEHP